MRNRKAYPKDWKKIALAAKENAGWTCVCCGILHGTPRRSRWTGRIWPTWLQAAHIRHDRENPSPAIAVVCPACHWRYYRQPGQRPAWYYERRKHRILLGRRLAD